ncbi:MAG: hypothetical protein Q8P95_02895 [bacterium]|nr:hypothetical protein [bacterium]
MPQKNPTPPETGPGETPLRQIRTFQGDVADALQRQKGSLVSIQQAEHLKQRSGPAGPEAPRVNSNSKAESFFLLLGSLMLFGLGTLGAWYGYHEFVRRTATPLAALPANRFVSADSQVAINAGNLPRETLINTLSEALRGVPAGTVKHVILLKAGTEKETSLLETDEFIEALGTQAPGSLVRAFDPLFMLGASGESIFLIIKLSSFENAFAGMLVWEKNLPQDVGALFATAPLLRNLTPESVFTDITDRNKDARMLAVGNQPILIYSFFDNNMLIITDSIETLHIVIERLTREKLSR